jgi:hypothetical protein
MDARRLTDALEHNLPVLLALLEGRSGADAARRPTPHDWSLLEIACHLLDEEREDFRARLRLLLEDPAQPWPPIDPEGWVTARGYAERDLATVLRELEAERRASVAWLRGLGEVDWTVAHEHPVLGPLRAGDLLTSWAAHDALHLRQLARRLHQEVERDAGDFSPDYAGPWTPTG